MLLKLRQDRVVHHEDTLQLGQDLESMRLLHEVSRGGEGGRLLGHHVLHGGQHQRVVAHHGLHQGGAQPWWHGDWGKL